MAHTYTAISAFVLDQLFGTVSANSIKNSLAYIAEDRFNFPFISNHILTNDLTVGGEFQGGRETVFYAGGVLSTSDVFLQQGSTGTTDDIGYIFASGGSIVSWSASGITTSFTSNLSTIMRLYNDGTNILSSSTLTWTANAQNQTYRTTISRGTNVFAAGNRLSCKWDYQSGTANVIMMVMMEVVLNS